MFLFAPACNKQVFFLYPAAACNSTVQIFLPKNQKNLYKPKKNRIFVH